MSNAEGGERINALVEELARRIDCHCDSLPPVDRTYVSTAALGRLFVRELNKVFPREVVIQMLASYPWHDAIAGEDYYAEKERARCE